MRLFARLVLAAGLVALSAAGASAEGKIGVILMHGKTGMPGQMSKLATALTDAGYVVARPEMCWSKQRIYDHAFGDCLADVDAAIGRAKAKGATEIVVGGTSLGAMAALAYAATHKDIIGVIAIVPASDPVNPAPFPAFAASLTKAVALAKAGKGDAPAEFDDIVTGGVDLTVNVSPDVFLSFHGPDSPIATVLKQLAVTVLPKITVPVLWVAGTRDPSQSVAPQAFARLPRNKLSQLVKIDADHAGAPDVAADAVLPWLTKLGGT